MTLKKLLAALLCLLLLAGCAAKDDTPAPQPETPSATETVPKPQQPDTPSTPQKLGEFEAQTLTGDTLTQEYFANADLTLINVWATFCGPCKKEMPDLGKLDRELENVQVLGIVTDVIDQNGEPDPTQVELAQALAEASEVDYPSLILNQSLANLGFAGLTGVPATLFVDSEGTLIGQGFYGAHDEASWREIIAERLEMLA